MFYNVQVYAPGPDRSGPSGGSKSDPCSLKSPWSTGRPYCGPRPEPTSGIRRRPGRSFRPTGGPPPGWRCVRSGRVPVRGYGTDLDLDQADDWENDACHSLAYAIVSGREFPDAGPLGFAAGHESLGWRYLRTLVDNIDSRIKSGDFAGFDYDDSKEVFETIAAHRARELPWTYALVSVADLEVDEDFEDVKTWLGEGEVPLAERAWTLLGYAGYQVCQEVFADFLQAKNQEV